MGKLAGRAIQGYLRNPTFDPPVVLIYGPDDGLVRERFGILAKAAVPDPDDPFTTADIDPDGLSADPVRLKAEAAALSPFGGRRLVRVRHATDSMTEAMTLLLDEPHQIAAVVLVTAGNLPTRSKLRKLVEAADAAVALPCYADDQETVSSLVRAVLGDGGRALQPEAVAWLTDHLGADRTMTRHELDKLALYLGPGAPLTLEAAQACVGDASALSLDGFLDAMAEGRQDDAHHALDRLLAEGSNPVMLIRSMQRHMTMLFTLAVAMAEGQSLDAAVASLRPPLFFKRKAAVSRQARLWQHAPERRLTRALALLTEAEVNAKTTGFPAHLAIGRVMTQVAQAARAGQRH